MNDTLRTSTAYQRGDLARLTRDVHLDDGRVLSADTVLRVVGAGCGGVTLLLSGPMPEPVGEDPCDIVAVGYDTVAPWAF